ncbi:MAG: ribulose-phosphate 3-epimerase [Deltaproteobacteria bacterium]|nr:ribulose-phosphate 3-epimerase [Deltaproteobacteria bacterium]
MGLYKIAPSVLCADFTRLGEEVKALERAGADLIHVDVMDGHFVPNITMGPDFVAAVRRATHLSIDSHLMVTHPESYLQAFKDAGSDKISVHIETQNVQKCLEMMKKLRVSAGLALNPQTSVQSLLPYLDKIDYILVMSVHPGFGGQKFIETTFEKISSLQQILKEKKLSIDISVDGGVNAHNIAQLKKAGATIFVAGNAIFKTSDYSKTIQEMREFL